jgi:hypothetical protein
MVLAHKKTSRNSRKDKGLIFAVQSIGPLSASIYDFRARGIINQMLCGGCARAQICHATFSYLLCWRLDFYHCLSTLISFLNLFVFQSSSLKTFGYFYPWDVFYMSDHVVWKLKWGVLMDCTRSKLDRNGEFWWIL